MRRPKKYGKTFLTVPLFRSSNYAKVSRSPFVWSRHPGKHYGFYLSLLGIINGLLGKVNLMLCLYVQGHTDEIVAMKLERKNQPPLF